jgi:hypothetical protein
MKIEKIKLSVAVWLIALAEWLMRDMPKEKETACRIKIEEFEVNTLRVFESLPRDLRYDEVQRYLSREIVRYLDDKIQIVEIDKENKTGYRRWTATLIWCKKKKQPF